MNISPIKLGYDIAASILEFLTETAQPVAVFPGRFQPFHAGHYSVYKSLVDKFGKDRVFIATSDVTNDKSPLSFDQKQAVINRMFGIPTQNIVKVKNPHAPTEIVSRFSEDTPLIVAVSEKDADRLGNQGKYYKPWNPDDKTPEGFRSRGYVFKTPEFQFNIGGQNISGTNLRNILGGNASLDTKKMLFKKAYGKFDPEVFNLLTTKLVPPKQPIKQPTASPRKNISKILMSKIKNPETGNDILVQTALKYDKNHPAYKAAYQLINRNSESIIMEGGAAGHLAHPYEDNDLTFNDLKEMVVEGLIGDFGGKSAEKMDGQNIMFTVRDGQVKFARNKSHIIGGAQNGMSVDDLIQKFSGRGELEKTFGEAGNDIQAAISKLSDEERNKLFANGHKFINAEIIHPSSQNVIPYGKNVIIFHNAIAFDDEANKVGEDAEAGSTISDALKSVNADKQKTYGMQGPNFLTFADGDTDFYSKKAREMVSEIERIQKQFGMSNDNTVGDFKQKRWEAHLSKSNIPPELVKIVAARLARGSKQTVSQRQLPPEVRSLIKNIEKSPEKMESAVDPIKRIILKTGVLSIKRAANLISSHNALAGQEIQKKVSAAIDSIRKSDNPDKVVELERQLKYLNDIGLDSILPSEGMVFTYNGKPYKFTGAFAPTNRILSLITYDKEKPKEEPASQKKPEPKKVPSNKTSIANKKVINPITKNNIKVQTALGYPEDHPAHKVARKLVGESTVYEGGGAFDNVSPFSRKEIESLVKQGLDKTGLSVPVSLLGNYKKDTLNDLDVGIDMADVGGGDILSSLSEKLKKAGIEHVANRGLRQLSMVLPTSDGKRAQIDFMFGNRKWMEKILSAAENSKLKGSHRNILLGSIMRQTEKKSSATEFSKFIINTRDGLMHQVYTKTPSGAKKVLYTELVSTNPNNVASMLFGKGTTWDDINTVEKIVKRMKSPNFKFKDKIEDIMNDYKKSAGDTKQVSSPHTDISNLTVINPQTKNKIKVKSALGYPEDHPAYKLAQQIIQRNQ